jgi:hypothetical protein
MLRYVVGLVGPSVNYQSVERVQPSGIARADEGIDGFLVRLEPG